MLDGRDAWRVHVAERRWLEALQPPADNLRAIDVGRSTVAVSGEELVLLDAQSGARRAHAKVRHVAAIVLSPVTRLR